MSDENTLWMGDIQPWMNESIIINSFQQFNIYPINVKLIKDKKKNINRNYCFVTFKNCQDAQNAYNLNGNKLPNVNINFKLNKAEHQTLKTAYVGNLNLKVGDNELYKLFSQKYKSVHHANVINEKGISKGFGFVIFKNEDDYNRCLKEMNGYNFYGNNIKVREKKKKDEEINNINNNNLIGKKNKNKNKNNLNEINEEKINNIFLNNQNNNDNN
jgi:RNA recognition motif-containing protein